MAATYRCKAEPLACTQAQLEGLDGTKTEDGMYCFTYFVNDSLKELSRTDFEGTPSKTLDRDQWHFGALRKYLDHVGDVYSPPRVTEEAHLQGLKGQSALGMTNGRDFRVPEHRKKALALIARKRPAVLLLSSLHDLLSFAAPDQWQTRPSSSALGRI